MEKLTLEALHITTWIAAWVGPVVLIWRFRAVGWLCGIFWFWWVSVLSFFLDCELDRYRVNPPPCEPYIMILGWLLGLIYCTLLLFAWVIVKVLIRGVRKLWELRRDRIERR
jgi:hypothetical protein